MSAFTTASCENWAREKYSPVLKRWGSICSPQCSPRESISQKKLQKRFSGKDRKNLGSLDISRFSEVWRGREDLNLRGAFYTPYSLSRGAPSATWVLPQMSNFFSRYSLWRREWDSNPRMLSHRRFSRPVLSTAQPSLHDCEEPAHSQTQAVSYHTEGGLVKNKAKNVCRKSENVFARRELTGNA